jgi:hypothetical protein
MQNITLNGKQITVSAEASIDEIRNALNVQKINEVTTASQPTMTTPAPGSFAASIRAMMDEARAGVVQARADGLTKVKEAVGKLTEAKTATAQVAASMAKTIEDEAASVLAELGQISNMPPET